MNPPGVAAELLFLSSKDIVSKVFDFIKNIPTNLLTRTNPRNEDPHGNLRKLLKILLKLGHVQVLDYMATYLATKRSPYTILVLIEEARAYGVNTQNAEDLFINLWYSQRLDLVTIEKFFTITKLNYDTLSSLLIKSGRSYIVHHLVQKLQPNSFSFVRIVNSIKNNRIDDDTYMINVMYILSLTKQYSGYLIGPSEIDKFIEFVFLNPITNHAIHHNLAYYLSIAFPDKLDSFESQFILSATPAALVEYASAVSFSNKRAILAQLIELRNTWTGEKNLVEFLQRFPGFQSLLPLL